MQVFSIGYEKQSTQTFCELLTNAGVHLLVDVRAAAWSQRPEFRKTALKNALELHGIQYLHYKEGGNPFRPKKGEVIDPVQCFLNFKHHVDQHPEIIDGLLKIVEGKNSALFCYESTRDRCHRGVLLNEMSHKAKMTIRDLVADPIPSPRKPLHSPRSRTMPQLFDPHHPVAPVIPASNPA